MRMNSHRSAVCDGDIVREAREKFCMSNQEMASACGISRGIVDRALSGKPVGFRSIAKIAEKLEVTVEALIGKEQVLPYSYNLSQRLFIGLEPHLDDKLCRITNELNERYGIDDPVCAIRYLIMTYVLTAKVVHSEERGE
jgi:transcriptional regulator with XRE-family HTH domain